ncbi:MAG: AraC family transcriptional regulator [Spirochaetes bacterium]|nr:AraC family transcriptional regulator [Spirochaetota bacterium]
MASLETITNNFIYFAGGVSLLVAVSELFVRNRRTENLISFSLFVTFGILMFQIGFIIDRTVLQYPQLFYLNLTFLYLVGTVGYFAYFLLVFPTDTLPARMIFYALPSLVALVFDIYFMTMSPEAQVRLLHEHIYSGDMYHHTPVCFLFAGAGLQIFIYLGVLFVRFLMIWIREGFTPVVFVSFSYLTYTIVAADMVIAGYVLHSLVLLKWGCFMMAALFISSFPLSQRFPRFLQLIIDESEKKARVKSLIDNLDVDRTILRLKECMTEKKMFMNEDLTLKDLADELSITVHQLSQVLNERLATNFNNFVNRYRINESKMILLDEPDRSVISIAFMVGFNTKSSFYNAFSRFTGTSPQDYRRENL